MAAKIIAKPAASKVETVAVEAELSLSLLGTVETSDGRGVAVAV